MAPSSTAEFVSAATAETDTPPLSRMAGSAVVSLSALSVALIEGVCAGLVLLKGVALFTGLFAVSAAGASSWIHEDQVRLPLIVLAAAAALLNLYMVGNGWRLRRNPAAAWRVRPLTAAEKRHTALVVAASLFTLALLAGEVYGHHVLHAG